MIKNFTIMEAREMSEQKLKTEIGKCSKQIEELGMNHEEACKFVSNIMNLGIAMQESLSRKKN